MKIETWTGHAILADDADAALLGRFSWYVNRTPAGRLYAQAREPKTGRRLAMHRFLMNAPAGSVVHHKNNDGLDNRRSNLEVTTNRQNLRYANEDKSRVHLHKQTGKWRAQVRDQEGNRVSLGLYATREGAAKAVADYRAKP